MRWSSAVGLIIAAALVAGCGGGGSSPDDRGGSKSENRVLEERAFRAHSAYLLAEAEVLAYRARTAPDRRYARRETALARALMDECQEAITETECSVGEQLHRIVDRMEAEAGNHSGSARGGVVGAAAELDPK